MCPLEVKRQCWCRDQCCLVLERPEGARAPPFSAAAASCSARVRALGDLPPQGAAAVGPLPSHIPYFGNLHGALETSLLGFLLSWEGKWIFYASVKNVLPLGSWNSNLGWLTEVHWLISSNTELRRGYIICKAARICFCFFKLRHQCVLCGIRDVGKQMFYFIFLILCDCKCIHRPMLTCSKQDFS